MPQLEIVVNRPQRWDVPFGDAMREEDVDQLLLIEPFRSIDPERFPANLPMRGILKNDARINVYQDGGIVVREGDYGSSAFLVLRGKVRIVLEGLGSDVLGRPPEEQKGFWKSMVAWWQNPRLPEVRRRLSSENGFTTNDSEQVEDLTQTRVFLQDVPRLLENSKGTTLHRGEIFGELAALTRAPRTMTAVADGEVVLLELRWQGLRDLMRRTDALRLHIERLYRENSLRVHLQETPLLAQLPAESLEAVADATIFETHGDFEWQTPVGPYAEGRTPETVVNERLIVEEGGACDGMVLVRSGFARLSHRYGDGHRTLAYLGKGQVYGLAEAVETSLSGEPKAMSSSLRALGYVDVLRIPQAVLEEHVFKNVSEQTIQQAVTKHALYSPQEYRESAREPRGQEQTPIETPLLEFLVERRLINGQQAMLIDLERCTRCDDCVRACAATHDNNPRMLRHGQRHGSYLVAHACMHCIDPVCMIGCPTGAIAREMDSGSVRINDLTCIGCSTCANSCPYDNILMAEVRDSRGAVAIDTTTQQPIYKATKCDLCADRLGGPACQHACPHDALVRIDLGNLGELSRWVGR